MPGRRAVRRARLRNLLGHLGGRAHWSTKSKQQRTTLHRVGGCIRHGDGLCNSLELHLSDADFFAKFAVDKAAYGVWPLWKQTAAKKKLRLF